MIGKKTVAELRAELLEQCTKEGVNPAVWFDEQIRKLERGPAPDPRDIETLELIRDGLLARARGKKPARKQSRARLRQRMDEACRRTRETGGVPFSEILAEVERPEVGRKTRLARPRTKTS